MKNFRIFIKTMLISICALALAVLPTKAYATQYSSTNYMMLYGKGNGRPTGFYWVYTKNSGANKPVIKIVRSSDASGSSTLAESADEAIFCIKDGIGFGSSDGSNGTTASVVNYNQYFNMRTPSSIDSTYKTNLPSDSTNYAKLMWILDHVVNPSDTTETANLLDNIGIQESDFDNYNTSDFGGKTTAEIKKDIIEAVEQAAIWHYTNAGTVYDPDVSPNFFRTSTNNGTPKSLDGSYGDGTDFQEAPHNVIYSYFINGAEKNASYDYANSGLTTLTLDSSNATTTTSGSNVLVGPYKINKTGDSTFTINATITSGDYTFQESEIKILNSTKSDNLGGNNSSEKIKSSVGSNFYISLPASKVTGSVKLNIKGNSTGRTITYWSAPANEVSVTQPVAIVKTVSQPINLTDEKATGKYNVVLVKEDSTGEQLNSTATFVVNGVTKTVTGKLTIAENVEINSSNVNTPDVYTIKETLPPDKYCAFDGTITITVNKKLENSEYVTSSDLISYKVTDDSGNEISKEGSNVYLKDGNIYVEVKDYQFDLALRKFITSINGVAPSTSREPVITQESLKALAEGSSDAFDTTTAHKTHTKDALSVNAGDKVVYTIRIYNEGDLDGKATEITDYLPEGLSLAENSEINTKYGWKADTTNSKKITSSYLANTNIAGFNRVPANGTYTIDYQDVQVECTVNSNITESTNLRNVAEITKEANDKNLADRDSTPNNLTNDQKNNYNPGTSTEGKGYEDDDDFEVLKPVTKAFDLALRKFITSINGVAPTVSREPVITQANLKALAEGGADAFDTTTTHKTHTKDPLNVSTGDKVIYTIRIYNEGDVDGKATEITDYLPEGLKLAENSEINNTYGWTADSSNSQIVRTTKLANTTLKAFSRTATNGQYIMTKEGGQIADVQIECEVTAHSATAINLKNVAEITKESNDQNLADRDSTQSNLTDAQKQNYNPSTSTEGKGYEDDDDYEILKLVRFDLALRKFITGVNSAEVTNRVPQVDTSKFGTTDENGNEVTTCTYNHTKEPVRVEHNDIVTYTIRIYNEGTEAGYASVVKDDLPEGIVFLPDNATNKEYRWKMYDADGNETDDVSTASYVTTDYLSKDQEKTAEANLLKAFDKDTMTSPDYKDVKIAFRVTMPNTSDRIVTNKAQISKHTDENGKEVKDIDSTPDKWIEGEDDQDIEKIYVKYFDLALRKWVTQAIVIEDGQEKVMNTGHKAEDDPESVVKVEINKKRLQNTVVKFKYSIRITNEGEIAGYATEISDYIPKGLKFNQADNPDWRETNGKIVTNKLKDTLLQPGDQGFVDVILTWENDENNMGVMTNVAEISADKNDSDTPDIDSTPNNKKEGEDDIDDAPVALTVNAGKTPTYTAIIASILSIVGVGAILIKKFAL